MTRIRNFFQGRLASQVGGVSAEYVAVIVIVAAVIAAVWAVDIQGTVGDCAETAVGDLFQEGTGEGGGGGLSCAGGEG